MSPGSLVLVPAWLSEDTPADGVVPAAALARLRAIDAFVVENARSARRFLAACGHPRPMRDLEMGVLDEHTPPDRIPGLLDPARRGRELGLITEAGMPGIADPGAALVAAAHREGIRVVPLAGASSIPLALAASGLEGQRFRFVGYLPPDGASRRRAIAELEARSARDRETQVFIETPYRNEALLADLLGTCRPATRLAVAAGLTGPAETIRMATVQEWREKPGEIGKRPAVFLLEAEKKKGP